MSGLPSGGLFGNLSRSDREKPSGFSFGGVMPSGGEKPTSPLFGSAKLPDDEKTISSFGYKPANLGTKTDSFLSNFQSPTVCIHLGETKEPYYLHSKLLRSKCPYFQAQAQFSQKSQTEAPQIIALDDFSNREAFAMFVQFIYTSGYTVPAYLGNENRCDAYIELYCMADFFMMDDLKRNVVQRLKQSLSEPVGLFGPRVWAPSTIIKFLKTVYERTNSRAVEILDNHTNTTTSCEPKTDSGVKIRPENTQASVGENRISNEQQVEPDPLRALFARYAASQLHVLRQDKDYAQMILEDSELALDILSFAFSGTFGVPPTSPFGSNAGKKVT